MLEIWQGIMTGVIAWFQGLTPQNYADFAFVLIKVLVIIIAIKIISKVGAALINRIFDRQTRPPFKMEERKAGTLKALFKSILRYVVYFVGGIMILGEFVNTASLLATAGIGGLAIGFGAQSLVKDIITGFFILFEDQYSVGDFVTIGEVTGTVEEIGLRITKIRGFKGELNIIPNGQVAIVTNNTRGNMLAVIDLPVSYETDVNQVIKVMDETAAEYAKENRNIVERPQVMGIMGMGSSDISIRLIARTLPMKQWEVERELRRRIKEAFDKNKGMNPYQHMVVILQSDKDKEA